jgi:hypothetical protein
MSRWINVQGVQRDVDNRGDDDDEEHARDHGRDAFQDGFVHGGPEKATISVAEQCVEVNAFHLRTRLGGAFRQKTATAMGIRFLAKASKEAKDRIASSTRPRGKLLAMTNQGLMVFP